MGVSKNAHDLIARYCGSSTSRSIVTHVKLSDTCVCAGSEDIRNLQQIEELAYSCSRINIIHFLVKRFHGYPAASLSHLS